LLAPSLSFNEESLADQMIDINISDADADDKSFLKIPSSPKDLDSLFELEGELFFNFKFIVTESLQNSDLFNIELKPIPARMNNCRLSRERFCDPLVNLFGMRFNYQPDDLSEKIILEIINVSLSSQLPECNEFLCSGLISCRRVIDRDDFLRVSSIATKVLIEEHVFPTSCKSFMSEDGKEIISVAVRKGVAASKVGLWFGCCILATIRDITITALESTKAGQ
jgi:hypothetical protein